MPSKHLGWRIYRDQMFQLGHGEALWEPAPIYSFKRVKLGDVGYVRRGQFHLLFSAGCPLGDRRLGIDVPQTFTRLSVGPIVHSQTRPPGCLSIGADQEVVASPEVSVATDAMLEPGCRMAFTLIHKKGAALVTKDRTYREDVERESALKAYTKRHYDSWVKFARDTGHGDHIKPVLVTGVDLTGDFAMMAFSRGGLGLKPEFSVSTSPVGSVPASPWGVWRKTGGAIHASCGPDPHVRPPIQTSDLSTSRRNATPDEYDQCVFVRYFTMRKKALLFPTVIRAAAGPHDLGPGNRDDEEVIRVNTRSDSGSSESDSDILSWFDDDRNDGDLMDGDDSGVIIHEAASVLSSPCPPVHSIYPEWEKDEPGVPGKEGDARGWDTEGYFPRSEGVEIEGHGVPGGEEDEEESDLDKIAVYIFQNSNANSALIHHRDIALVRAPGDTRDISLLLSEKQPCVLVDSDLAGQIGLPLPHMTSLGSGGSGYVVALNNLLQIRGSIRRLVWDIKQDGPSNSPQWTASALLDGVERGYGTGSRKSEAKEEAARLALRYLALFP